MRSRTKVGLGREELESLVQHAFGSGLPARVPCGHGHALVFTEEVRHRLNLYRAYLCLIMVIEGAPRGYSGLKYMAIRKSCQLKLRGELKHLAARA